MTTVPTETPDFGAASLSTQGRLLQEMAMRRRLQSQAQGSRLVGYAAHMARHIGDLGDSANQAYHAIMQPHQFGG
jgi:hypothetical protein